MMTTVRATATYRRLGTGLWPDTAILRGRGTHYAAHGPAGAVSLKSVLRGTTTWTANGRRFVLTAGMHLLLGEGEYAVEIDSPRSETATLCVFFEPGFLDDIAAPALDADRPRFEWHECIHAWDERVWPLLQRLDDSEESIVALGEVLVAQREDARRAMAALTAAKASTRAEVYRRVLRGRDFLLSSLRDPVTMQHAARAAAMSPYHFHRAFGEAFGAPPHRYLAERRLERAAHLLRTTSLPANEIASEAGFASVTSFTAAFRRRYGRPPHAWRAT